MGKRTWWQWVGAWLLVGVVPVCGHGAEAAKPKPTPAPRWSDMQALVLRTPFDNFRYPHLGKNGSVTFIADDAYSSASKGLNHGIFRYQADGSLVCLVRGGETTVPGGEATLQTIQGLQMDDDGADFVFNAHDSDKGRGLYRWAQGKLEKVARVGETVLPGDTGTITDVEFGTIQGTRLLYKATSEQLGPALVLHDFANGRDRVLCHGGVAMPAHPDSTFEYISSTNWIGADSVVFRAASVANPLEKGGKNTEGIYGWFGIKDWSGAGGEFAPERLRTVIDGSAQMPLGEGVRSAAFNLFGSAPVSGDHTGFEAGGDQFAGIFAAQVPDGPVSCVVSNRTEFDGPLKGHFTSFGGYPTIVGENLIFTAQARADAKEKDDVEGNAADDDDGAAKAPKAYHGVFVYRLDRGELFTLTDNREPLDGEEVASYEIGGHFLVDDHFVVTVHFQDKSSRIYLGTIRPEAFKQLNGDAAPAPPPAAAP